MDQAENLLGVAAESLGGGLAGVRGPVGEPIQASCTLCDLVKGRRLMSGGIA